MSGITSLRKHWQCPKHTQERVVLPAHTLRPCSNAAGSECQLCYCRATTRDRLFGTQATPQSKSTVNSTSTSTSQTRQGRVCSHIHDAVDTGQHNCTAAQHGAQAHARKVLQELAAAGFGSAPNLRRFLGQLSPMLPPVPPLSSQCPSCRTPLATRWPPHPRMLSSEPR